MTDTKHTPGPWVCGIDSDVTIDGDDVQSWIAIGPECAAGVALAIADYDRFDDELWANAHLIAAAPDLLAALRDCLAFLDADCAHMPSANPERATARAAIAKAMECGE
jgi:hypothetical protein